MISSNKVVDLIQNISFEEKSYVGKSICVLAKFAAEKLPIPNGFVITALGFNQFVDFSDLKKYSEKSKGREGFGEGLQNAFSVVDMPGILRKQVSELYNKISGFTDAYVNIRAIILDEDGNELLYDKFEVNDIRSEDNLSKEISRLYSDVVTADLEKAELYFEGKLQIVVIVQKSVQSEASGVMYTSDLITKDNTKLVIEAVYGIMTGAEHESIIPDQYIFDKNTNTIQEKHISAQEFMIVRQLGVGPTTQKVAISPAWQKRQKIDDKHILVLAKTGLLVAEELNEDQEITWSFEAGKIWINFIESTQRLSPKNINSDTSLQNQIDSMISGDEDGTDLNFHIPQDLVKERELLVDLVLKESDSPKIEKKSPIMKEETQAENKRINQEPQKQLEREPLLEGAFYAGDESHGEVSFDPENSRVNNILVLKGDEDIPSTLKVAGMVIEDESDILAERLFEYFKVPVITGVPLARKILKKGESITINGKNGNIYEMVPYKNQTSDIEMTFVNKIGDKKEVTNFTIPVVSDKEVEITAEIQPKPETKLEDLKDVPISEILKAQSTQSGNVVQIKTDSLVATEESINTGMNNGKPVEIKKVSNDKVEIKTRTVVPDYSQKKDQKSYSNPFSSQSTSQRDLSKLLDLVESEEAIQVDEKEFSKNKVEGISANDQMRVWGKSLEKMISASKGIPAPVAANALEHVIEDTNTIADESKEFAFDEEERFIAEVKAEEEPVKAPKEVEEFMPTATKVFVGLIDEKLDSDKQNFDGVVFTSTYDSDVFVNVLEDVLIKAEDKPVQVICPPYESVALSKFFKQIYELRNKGYRNLSLILPDYRNKKDLSEYKKLLTSEGLRRSSTFEILANLSKTINVFRISELEEAMVDGVYVDLFRLKMNMLGVEKMSASTRYVEGMQNLVEYVHENLSSDGKTLVNITAFDNQKLILEHLAALGFWGIVCEQDHANQVKKTLSTIEQKLISNPKTKGRK